jgi:hypothetical protein
MESIKIKDRIISRLLEIDDMDFLKAMDLLTKNKSKKNDVFQLNQEQKERIILARKEYEQGLTKEHEVFSQEIEAWLNTKWFGLQLHKMIYIEYWSFIILETEHDGGIKKRNDYSMRGSTCLHDAGRQVWSLKNNYKEMKAALQIDLTFDQILSLVKQLPKKEKIKLSKELEKEAVDSKLTRLLESFKTDQLDLKTIDEEVEIVRKEMYDKKKH